MNIFDKKTNALQKTIYLERYVNDGSPSGFTQKNNTSRGTRAYDFNEYFRLPILEFETKFISFEAGSNHYIPKNQILVHPDMLDYVINTSNAKLVGYVKAIPFSSGRTVYIPEWNVFVKLQYNQLLGRLKRSIEKKNVIHSLAVNKILSEYQSSVPQFCFYPEIYGKIAQLKNGESVGILFRKFETLPKTYNSIIHIPGFSLFSKDLNAPNDVTILSQLVASQQNKQRYILDSIILPLVSIYFDLLIHTGLQIEAHAQNICFLYDGEVRGIAVRDFESIDKDWEIAKELNPLFDINYKCVSRNNENYAKRHSFMYDFKLGEYLIKPIIINAASLGCDQTQMISCVKSYVQKFLLQLPDDFFPQNHWYSYPNTLIDRSSAKRPYIEHFLPDFR